MLKSRAMVAVDAGRAILVNGMVRFLEDQTHLGYNTAPEYSGIGGRQSGFGGPTVVQYFRPKFEL